MDNILFNSDGSINKAGTHLNQYIMQGENSKQIEVKIEDIEAPGQLVAELVCTLPNSRTVLCVGTWSNERKAWIITLTDDVTLYNGIVLAALRIRDQATGTVRVMFPFSLVINETGVKPEDDTGVTLEELDGFLDLFKGWIEEEISQQLDETIQEKVNEKVEEELDDFNLENGTASYSLQQKADVETEHVKGGTAAGDNSIALGLGDTYEQELTVYTVSPEFKLIVANTNPNWQNMALEYDGNYYRIIAVAENLITLESEIPGLSAGNRITGNIVTQLAAGEGSFVWGEYCQAFGDASQAGGIACKAIGHGSLAGGYYSLANQAYAFAWGQYVISAGIAQAVFGKFNNVNFNDLFIVGNGSEGHPSDAFIVRQDGRVTIGADPADSLDAATKNYVDNFHDNSKRNLSTERKVVYATSGTETQSGSGIYTQTTISYSAGLNNGCLVQRDGTQIMVPDTPTQNNHATSKKYVDEGSYLKTINGQPIHGTGNVQVSVNQTGLFSHDLAITDAVGTWHLIILDNNSAAYSMSDMNRFSGLMNGTLKVLVELDGYMCLVTRAIYVAGTGTFSLDLMVAGTTYQSKTISNVTAISDYVSPF